MKRLTPIMPYLAVAVGLFCVRHALALLGFPLALLFRSRDARRVLLNVLPCGSSGISLYIRLAVYQMSIQTPPT